MILRRQLGLFGLEKNENGHMTLMRLRPGANDLETCDELLTGTAIIQFLHMHHFESRFAHETLRIKVGVFG